jgi:hypothetical protein
MNGTFNVLGSAYGVDRISYNQRQHEERRKREELDARVARFQKTERNGCTCGCTRVA